MGNEIKTVVVLGMHRSGTSLTAGLLSALGVNMGELIRPSKKFNPKGYFEDRHFLDLNEEILKAAGGRWDDPPSTEDVLAVKNQFNSEIAELVSSRQFGWWGWKDPRNCLTLSLYWECLVSPSVIVCKRNLEEVGRSLQRRYGWDRERGKELGEIYNRRIDDFVECFNPRKVVINFRDYREDAAGSVDRLIEFLGIEVGSWRRARLIRFIDPLLMH